jgi:hypothetical protein
MSAIPYLTEKLAVCMIVRWITSMTAQVMAQPLRLNAEILHLKGLSSYSADNGRTWSPARVGDVLKPGTLVKTGKENSKVDLLLETKRTLAPQPTSATGTMTDGTSRPEFSKANVVRIMENSVLGIDKLNILTNGFDTLEEIQLDLRAGKIIGDGKRLSAASRFEIKIPMGVCALRGSPIGLMYGITSTGVVRVFQSSYVHTWAGDVASAGMYVAFVRADGSAQSMITLPDNAPKRFGPIPGWFFGD